MSLREYMQNLVSDCAAAQSSPGENRTSAATNIRVTIVSDNPPSYTRQSSTTTIIQKSPEDNASRMVATTTPVSVTTILPMKEGDVSTSISTILNTWDFLEEDLFQIHDSDHEHPRHSKMEDHAFDELHNDSIVTSVRSILSSVHKCKTQSPTPLGIRNVSPLQNEVRKREIPQVSLRPRKAPIPPDARLPASKDTVRSFCLI